jgi:Phosphotransferase enzyme family
MGWGYAAFPEDPDLLPLRIAGNPTEMLRVFRDHLQPVTNKRYRIQDCQIARVRYRRGVRCVFQYNLRLVETKTGQEQCQWVTGVLYAGCKAERSWRRLQAAHSVEEFPMEFLIFKPVCYIPELRMLVQVFPYDRRLPFLREVMAGPSLEFRQSFLPQFGPGIWDIQEYEVEPIRYRAQLGAVLRYTVHARDRMSAMPAVKRFFAKVYRDDEGKRTFEVHNAVAANAAGGVGFTVPQPIAYSPKLHTLLLAESPGISLLQALVENRATAATLRRIARALAHLNQDAVATPRLHGLQDEIDEIRRADRILGWCCPALSTEIHLIVRDVVERLEAPALGNAHRDLKPEHILIKDGRLALLDLDWLALSDPVLDPATLLVCLSVLPMRFALPKTYIDQMSWAFAEEYFAAVRTDWHKRFALHYVGAALKEAVGFFRRQEPCWPDHIAELVRWAREALKGKPLR